MGGYAPTIGIIGTVIGLVQVLQSLEDPAVLGPLVAGAFVATLWGVLSANVIWLPMSAKIRRNSDLRAAADGADRSRASARSSRAPTRGRCAGGCGRCCRRARPVAVGA